MKNRNLMIPLLVFSSFQLSVGQLLPGQLSIVQEWPGNLNGLLTVPITEQVTDGWTLEVKFSEPVTNLQIWDAQVVTYTEDSKNYILKNQNYNEILTIGTALSLGFIGSIDGYTAPTARVTLFGSEEDALITQPPPPTPDVMTDAVLTGELIIEETWDKHFKGIFVIDIPQRISGGWTLEAAFTKRVKSVEIWDAEIQSVYRKKTYTFVNKQYNSKLDQGITLSIQFIGQIYFKRPPAATVTLKPYYLHPYEPTTASPPVAVQTDAATAPSAPSTTRATTPSSQDVTTAKPVQRTERTEVPVTNSQKRATTQVHVTDSMKKTTAQVPVTDAQTRTTAQAPVTDAPKQRTTESNEEKTTGAPVQEGPYDYDEVLHKSILFYEAQRSGALPVNNRVEWRKDSAVDDHGENGEDLSGGWYDAGDYVKFGLPMAWSATTLAWGVLEYRSAFQAAGELEYVLDSIKWATDYFLKCHTDENEFYAQVGDGHIDHSYWGRPEDMDMERPAFKVTSSKPGSDVAGQTAATLAAASMIFRDTDTDYATQLMDNAKSLYSFANTYRGVYSDSVPASPFYTSYSGYGDELALAAAWLYRATNDTEYLNDAKAHYQSFRLAGTPWAFSWDDSTPAVQLLMYLITGEDTYKNDVESFINTWLPGGGVPYTPKGLAFRDTWGSLRYAANTAFLSLVAADNGINQDTYREFAESQIHYMLGDAGRSYVVGFGVNPPQQPHHASSSCPDKPATCDWNNFNSAGPNPHVLHGALVGGPDGNDNYVDVRSDYVANEVACDYNAGFQSAVAGLKNLYIP